MRILAAAAAAILALTSCAGGDQTGDRTGDRAGVVDPPTPSAGSADPSSPPAGARSSEPPRVRSAEPAEPPEEPTEEPTVPTPPSTTALSGDDQARLDARLLAAAWRDDVGTARRLVVRGADVNAKDDTAQSVYLVATSEGYLGLLDLTLRHGADLASLDSYQGTGLIRAAERGHADIVGRLLQEGPPAGAGVDHVNNLGWTALLEAVILGDGTTRYVDTVRALVAGGADVLLAAEEDGLTPIQHAQQRGQADVVATLRAARRADSRSRSRADAEASLLRAARSGDADAVALALRDGARLEVRDNPGRTALLQAALRDHVDVARLLIVLGADPDAQDERLDTPWLVTGVTGSVAMLETLLPAAPDLDLRNRYGGVSVIPASERGHVAYVRRVVRTDIDLDHVNDLGWTALLEAVVLGDGSTRYQQIVRLLLGAGADPAIADSEGVTPLQHARSNGQLEVARILAAGGPRGG